MPILQENKGYFVTKYYTLYFFILIKFKWNKRRQVFLTTEKKWNEVQKLTKEISKSLNQIVAQT